MSDAQAMLRPIGLRRRAVRSVTWFGEAIVDVADPAADASLAAVLYEHAYARGIPRPIERVGAGWIDPGWRGVVADARLSAEWSGWRPSGPGLVQVPGEPRLRLDVDEGRSDPLVLPLRPLSFDALPGWLLLRHGDARRAHACVRVYANTEATAVRGAIPSLIAILRDSGMDSFSLKFLLSGEHLDRADSTVIYLPERPSRALLSDLALALDTATAARSVPMFTLRLAPGLAIAASPSGGRSFGLLRCSQLATAVLHRFRTGSTAPPVFAFDETAPWDDPDRPRLTAPRLASRPRTTLDRTPVEGLHDVAADLMSAALVANGAAAWLVRDRMTGRWRSSDASVYSGAIGALLVFAQADRLDGGDRYRRILRATAQGILGRLGDLSSQGFHSGIAGTAAVLAEAAAISGDAMVDDSARTAFSAAIRRTCAVPARAQAWDVISGDAGTLLGLIGAAGVLGEQIPEGVPMIAATLAAQHEADVRSGGVRWRTRIGRRSVALGGPRSRILRSRAGTRPRRHGRSPRPPGSDVRRRLLQRTDRVGRPAEHRRLP
ncbi:T3SS effector HopA1 family protein [Rathayibacter oskolensis]|nr:T3SS effector HopA1 family protein [Rathayibacter oskolensis]WKK70919.1 T3SS effector HopA1 family protein [Rathayibacter oskolensis]